MRWQDSQHFACTAVPAEVDYLAHCPREERNEAQLLTSLYIPESDRLVHPAGRDHVPSRTPRDAKHGAQVPAQDARGLFRFVIRITTPLCCGY